MKKVALLDVCHSDYFTGYHKPVLAVPVYYGMLNSELAESMEQEISVIWDILEEGYDQQEISLFDTFIQECNDKGAEFFIPYPNPDDIDNESDEMPYAYFAIINPVYINGLMFLDN